MMERRAYERLLSELQARILYGDIVYTGMVTNLSENGMSIKSNRAVEIGMLKNGQTVKITVKVRRSGRSSFYNIGSEDHGIGVVLINPPRGYLEFVKKSRTGSHVLHK